MEDTKVLPDLNSANIEALLLAKLPVSKLVKEQKKVFVKEINGKVRKATVRYDDQCGNGHNYFSVTYAEVGLGGCCLKEVEKYFPELAKYIKWHLCSSDGPFHYVANTLHFASTKDCHGLEKGEKRQLKNGKTGLPAWHLVALDKNGNEVSLHELTHKTINSETQPEETYTLSYQPWCRIGEGKEFELESARRSAIWPEAQPEDITKEKLLARLPALLEEFKRDVEELGFVY